MKEIDDKINTKKKMTKFEQQHHSPMRILCESPKLVNILL